MTTTHEAKAEIKSHLAAAGIEIGRSDIGGNARWIGVQLADVASRDSAASALRAAGMVVEAPADLARSLYVIR